MKFQKNKLKNSGVQRRLRYRVLGSTSTVPRIVSTDSVSTDSVKVNRRFVLKNSLLSRTSSFGAEFLVEYFPLVFTQTSVTAVDLQRCISVV